MSARHRKKKRTLSEFLLDVPGSVWGTLVGGLFGLLAAPLFDMLVTLPVAWAQSTLWWVILIFCIVLGRTVGKALDAHETE